MDRAAEHGLLDRYLDTGAEYGCQPSALLDEQLSQQVLGANGKAMGARQGHLLATEGVVVAKRDALPVDAFVTFGLDPLNHAPPIAGQRPVLALPWAGAQTRLSGSQLRHPRQLWQIAKLSGLDAISVQTICLLTSSLNTPSTSISSLKEPLCTTFPACNT